MSTSPQTSHEHHGTENTGSYRLRLDRTPPRPGRSSLTFTVLGPDGLPVTAYTPTHDRELHLIVVRRDLTDYWHLHPERQDDGTWTVRLDLPAPGAYRVFADLSPKNLGRTITLDSDLVVSGPDERRPLPKPTTTVEVDGYQVTLTGDLAAGQARPLRLTVHSDGEPVTDLQPYLAAYGHLVVLRAEDLAYIHVHPNGEPGDGTTAAGPDVGFHVLVPTSGTYRLFLDFKHGDTVRTAAFTATA